VLDTETKGTGAQMVPLEKVLRKPAPAIEPILVEAKRPPPAPEEPEPRVPRRFKIVDVMTEQVLAEDVDARAAVEALGDVRSVVDVRVYVWDRERDRWRLLTLGEQQLLWRSRGERHVSPR
jgi:hypothetical protein